MKYKVYYRRILTTGEVEKLTFESKMHDGYGLTYQSALAMVNQWNTMASARTPVQYIYWIE